MACIFVACRQIMSYSFKISINKSSLETWKELVAYEEPRRLHLHESAEPILSNGLKITKEITEEKIKNYFQSVYFYLKNKKQSKQYQVILNYIL